MVMDVMLLTLWLMVNVFTVLLVKNLKVLPENKLKTLSKKLELMQDMVDYIYPRAEKLA